MSTSFFLEMSEMVGFWRVLIGMLRRGFCLGLAVSGEPGKSFIFIANQTPFLSAAPSSTPCSSYTAKDLPPLSTTFTIYISDSYLSSSI